MASPLHVAKYGTYDEFCAVYDPVALPSGLEINADGFLAKALANEDPQARLAIANRLLDDGADPRWVSTDRDRVNVFHVLWGRERDHDPIVTSTKIGRASWK